MVSLPAREAFNWHRSLILALVRQEGIAALLFRSLFR